MLNRIRDLIRGTVRRGVPLELSDALRDDSPPPMEIAIKQQETAQFLDALARLKPADRQLIVWRIELGYSADEIATKLGKSRQRLLAATAMAAVVSPFMFAWPALRSSASSASAPFDPAMIAAKT